MGLVGLVQFSIASRVRTFSRSCWMELVGLVRGGRGLVAATPHTAGRQGTGQARTGGRVTSDGRGLVSGDRRWLVGGKRGRLNGGNGRRLIGGDRGGLIGNHGRGIGQRRGWRLHHRCWRSVACWRGSIRRDRRHLGEGVAS